jgi:hypothetical protein
MALLNLMHAKSIKFSEILLVNGIKCLLTERLKTMDPQEKDEQTGIKSNFYN